MKEYLFKYREAYRNIGESMEEFHRLGEELTATGAILRGDPVQSSRDPDKMARLIEKHVDMEREIESEFEELIKFRYEVLQMIRSLPDLKQQEVLRRRYMMNKTWEQIAEDMDISDKWVYVLHGRALQEIEKILDNGQ